jgi:serine/threonine protein kinase
LQCGPAMLSGCTFERFRMTRPLARGGMGEIWLAEDGADGVVVKTIRDDLLDDEEVIASFQREIDVTARLDHPHTVRHVAHGRWEGTDFLAVQKIDGISLWELTQRERMPLGAALCVAHDIAKALAYVHALESDDGVCLGAVHGDVSPQNILVDERGHAHLIDFGAVKLGSDGQPDSIIGKPSYLSPEQSRGGAIDARSDQYSLGIVLWEMIAARSLFDGNARRRGVEIPSLAGVVGAVAAADTLVGRMLAFERDARFENTAACARAIEKLDPRRNAKSRAWLGQAATQLRPAYEQRALRDPAKTVVLHA